MVVQAAIPIITAVGEFTTPYLLRKAGEIGLTRFIQVYGSAAATAIGIQKTQPVDLQTEKILGMPVSHITGQGEVYDDTDYSAIDEDREVEPLKYLPGIHGPKTKEQEEIEKIGQKETFPIQEWDKSYTDTGTKMPEEKKFEPPISPPVELPESKGFPDLSEEFNKPQIFTQAKTKDITKQTEELVPKIKNKITTWEDHFPTIEEATKAAKDVGGTLREFKEGVIQKKTTFRKQGDGFGFDIYFDKKYIGELTEIDPYKEDTTRKEIFGNMKSYVLRYINEDGYLQDGDITLDGQKYAKEKTKELVARDLLQESSDFRSLRKIFQEMEYNKKGQPVTEGERTSDITKQTKDLVKEKPEFGALTEVEKQTAIALKGDKPDYYSRVVKAISDHKQDKMSAGEWKNVIGIQGTKDEMDFLGLTKKLQGDKSITKEDLLAEVSAKDIAPKIYVTSIPKEDWVSEFGEYSLGFEKEGTQEQIVFQIDTLPKTEADIEFGLSGMEYQAPSAHVIEKHGRNQIAHARTQVGYGDPDAPPADIGEKGREVSEKLKNTLIIDEIQSDWIQRIQKYGTKDEPKAKVLKGSEITPQFIKENFGDFYDLKIEKFKTQKDLLENTGLSTNKVLYSTDKATGMRGVVKRIDEDLYYVFTYKGLTSESKSVAFSEKETAIDHAKDFAASNLPIKKSKKYVELVLREMIKKATNDGRDSIAITNGNIQLDRSKEEGNKWFYDNIVLGELEKIAKQYGVKVETINIEPDKYLKLQENLKKIEAKGFEETTVTANDLKNYLNARTNVGATLPDFREVIMNEGVSFRGGYFDQMLNTQHPQHASDEYVVFKNKETGEINFEYPTVNKKFMLKTDKTLKRFLEGSQQWAESRGGALIKMKLPKKLQKDILKEPIKISKIDKQTQRLVA